MQAYSFNKGRQGLLISPDGNATAWQLTKNLSITDDELVIDPIRLYNFERGIAVPPRDSLEITAYNLARTGYSVFERKSREGRRYAFAVMVTEMDTEMD